MSTYSEENRLMRNTLTLLETMFDNHEFQTLDTKDESVINLMKETINTTLNMIIK